MKLQMWKPKHPPGSVDTTSSITASSASQLRHRLDATMFRPHQSSSTTLSSVEIPLIHFNKAPAQSEASLRSTDSRTLSSSSLPKPAQTFRRSRSNASLEILADVIFALLSAVFFVYGLYVVRYNGKAIADYPEVTDRLINATKIVCACI